jgi:hypothetical protein
MAWRSFDPIPTKVRIHPSYQFERATVALALRPAVAAQIADETDVARETNRRIAEYERWAARSERENAKGRHNVPLQI